MSSTDVNTNISTDGIPSYMEGGGDPALANYYPAWLDNLADNVTLEGSMLDGAVQGAEGARAIFVAIRSLYGDSQVFRFAGPYGDNDWVEDYIAVQRADGDKDAPGTLRALDDAVQHRAL